MALLRSNHNEIPKDAVRLTEQEAIEFQWKMVEDHYGDPLLTTMRFSPGILGALGAVTGVLVNNHYRTRLRLGQFGYVSSYVPIVVLPAIMASLFHRTFIQSLILLPKGECPLCLQVRAAAIQGFFGTVYPSLLAPLASYMFAVRHFTYKLPSITEDPFALLKIFKKMTKPITMGLTLSLGLNMAVAAALTYREQLNILKLQHQIMEEERQAEEEASNSQDM